MRGDLVNRRSVGGEPGTARRRSPARLLVSFPVIVGAGIDIVAVARIEAALARRGDRFRERVFTEAEVRECGSRRRAAPQFALRFAAKEAGMKAIGTGWRDGVAWRDFETLERGGRFELRVSGRALELARERGFERAWLGASWTRTHAVAHVVIEGRGPRSGSG